MTSINVAEARKDFAALMTRVAYQGERIVIERHGKPLLAWVSIEDLRRLEKLDQQAAGSVEQERALAQAAELRRQILASRGGVPLPDSAEMIRQMRDEH